MLQRMIVIVDARTTVRIRFVDYDPRWFHDRCTHWSVGLTEKKKVVDADWLQVRSFPSAAE